MSLTNGAKIVHLNTFAQHKSTVAVIDYKTFLNINSMHIVDIAVIVITIFNIFAYIFSKVVHPFTITND